MRAEFITSYPSPQTRIDWPEPYETPHPRAIEMAETMREEAGAFGSCTYAGLKAAGYSEAEIIEHEPAARQLVEAAFVRQVEPAADRVADIIQKALAAAAHQMPMTADIKGVREMPDDAVTKWRRYCAARAAFKLDPWTSQGERCLHRLNDYLKFLPLLPREVQRIIFAVAAAQKVDVMGVRK